MKHLLYIILIVTIISCDSNEQNNNEVISQTSDTIKSSKPIVNEQIIGERIDGPANIRNKPNGELLFELYDNSLVEVSSESKNDWYEVLVYADIDYNEFEMDSINKGRYIIANNDTLGKVIKSHYVSTGKSKDYSYAMLYGYTHKNNIKPETVLENALQKYLQNNQRNLDYWKIFIKSFALKEDAIEYKNFKTYYNYESCVDDPSPGFRIVLLFDNKELIGLIHSRKLNIHKTKTYKLNWSYYITFFEKYTETEQKEFVDFMNEWINGVD